MDRMHKTHFTEEQNSLLLLNAIRIGFNISYWCAVQISAQKPANELEMSLMQSRDALSQFKTRISFGIFFLAAWKNRMTYCDSIILINHVQVLEFLAPSDAWS